MKNVFTIISLIAITVLATNVRAQTVETSAEGQPTAKIKWYTFKEALALHEKQPKTILIDMYTDWCGWCKKMDAETFTHPGIVGYVNTFFYPVKFDAERKDTVEYRGQKFGNKGEGRRPSHDLAIQLLRGKMSYPTLVFIDDQYNVNPIPGYRDPAKLEPLLIYFAERINKSAPFDQYNTKFAEVFHEKINPEEKISWITFDEAIERCKTEPRKTIINICSKNNRGSEVMNKTTFTHPEIARYINEKFYAVKIEAETTDTLMVGEQVFVNEMKGPNYPHQLPIALLGGKMFYPTMVYLDEQSKMINKVNGYMTPQGIEPILHYIGENKYNDGKWEEFRQNFVSKIE